MMNLKDIKSTINMHYSEMYEINELKERRLYINSEIDDEVIDTIVFHIMNYNREDKGIDEKDRKLLFFISTVQVVLYTLDTP